MNGELELAIVGGANAMMGVWASVAGTVRTEIFRKTGVLLFDLC